ncbi:MAG: hypothetical protein K9J16_01150 [Melioribacteraceae bacterium]|nr:hypothetical protein [Melioribacteraceae bacterium]MCF8356168.1 hypothetical protein [Melioribacteraceae bacterium]MCF8392334.1 hypothetical protein [Melioribacteraceae bacterium]MCF8417666.1 hypothetical protein [Melioribacteraceae bacterium]
MKRTIFLSLLLSIALIFITSCKEDTTDAPVDDPATQTLAVNSCEGCHTNYETLKAVYTPDPPSTGGGGCGGDAPHYEPYDRVYLDSEKGYADFKSGFHGSKLECTDCHNGVDGTSDKNEAHSGDFVSHPSKQAETFCAPCHKDIYNGTKNSLHEQGLGQKRKVFGRAGLGSYDDLSAMMKDGYDHNCAKCHATCGDCHVLRPAAGGGGLYSGHKFTKTPDMRDICVTCHVSRGGHAYFGIARGTVPDVHKSELEFTCLDCHTQQEVHGDGNVYEHRYQMTLLPKCENCHTAIASSNTYHSVHLNTFSCYTCHSQDFNNCGSCHIGEGARIPSYQGYKIGMNPLVEKPYKYALLRRTLSAPDSWMDYGIDNLASFDAFPTYNYTTPHNIIKWTTRTQVEDGKPCFDACHIITEGDSTRNKELYLFNEDLLDWEVNANSGIIVDGQLPAGWEK